MTLISINYRDPRPIYEQVKDGFCRLLVAGVLDAGDKLPSVRELAAQLAINPNTIQRAYRELEADGIIHRKLYPVVPPRTEYRLTELGKTLVPIVHAMSDWGHEYFEYLGLPDPCPED